MNRFIEGVKEFHTIYGAALDHEVTPENFIKSAQLANLRWGLMLEELEEFRQSASDYIFATKDHNHEKAHAAKVKMLDGITDLLYVVVGTALAFGLDLETAFERVQESNLSKLDEHGRPIYRADGKVLKGPNFKEPFLDDLV